MRAPYLSISGERIYKIGITKDTKKRRRDLSKTNVPGAFEECWCDTVISSMSARDVERETINWLTDFRYSNNRELFVFESDEEAVATVSHVIKYIKGEDNIDPMIITPDYIISQLESGSYEI